MGGAYRTTRRRAVLAGFAVVASAGVLAAVLWIAILIGGAVGASGGPGHLTDPAVMRTLRWSLGGATEAAFATAGATAVAVLVAAPAWRWFDRRGLRGPWSATLAGAGVGAAAGCLLVAIGLAFEPTSIRDMLLDPLFGALLGAPLGLLGWRVAYRRDPSAADVAEAF